jgi:hypothetical protein
MTLEIWQVLKNLNFKKKNVVQSKELEKHVINSLLNFGIRTHFLNL